MNTGQRTVASLAVVSVLLGISGQAVAVIINVPGDQPTIQAGIDAAVDGDEVVVAVGTYIETIDFLGKTITVRSTDPLDPAVVAATIIDPPGPTAVTINNALGSGTVLSGFTVSGGDIAVSAIDGILGPTLTNCVFSDNGISSGPTLFFGNCVFPSITNCTISGNGGGGGLHSSFSSPIVRNCLFEDNFGFNGGGMRLEGGGPLGFQPEVTDHSFTQNSAQNNGGGIYSASGNRSVITNCTFTNNTALNFGGGYYSEYSNSPITQLVGCTFIGNSVHPQGSRGGAVGVQTATIVDCTFTDNSSPSEGGGINCVGLLVGIGLQFCGNLPNDVVGSPASLSIACNPKGLGCPADLDGDGVVGVPDLLTLLAAWGACL